MDDKPTCNIEQKNENTHETELMIQIESEDKKTSSYSIRAVLMSTTIRNMLRDLGTNGLDSPIYLPFVDSETLQYIMKYCDKYKHNPPMEAASYTDDDTCPLQDMEEWDKQFVNSLDNTTLFRIIEAADFLDIQPLIGIVARKIASVIRGKSVEQLREEFDLINDFTPEEEELLRKENEWCSSLT